MKTAYNVNIRSSQLGGLWPADNAKVDFTETHIDKLIEAFNSAVYDRYEESSNKYFEKGNERENLSITLVSRVMKKMFVKNKTRLTNDFITGEWDLHEEENGIIVHTLDTKTCWSKNTFDKARLKKDNINYIIQGHCYMWLTGAKKHTIAYCLVNGTYQSINDEIRKLSWKMGVLDASVEEDPNFIKKVKQIERNHIFNLNEFMIENPGFELRNEHSFDSQGNYVWAFDIPMHERLYTKTFERDEKIIEKAKNRVIQCRQWMNKNMIINQ
jgi:hypothetical protein